MDDSELQEAIRSYNRRSIGELEAESGLRYLGDDKVAYQAGHIRIAGIFIDPDGQHWADAPLVAESMISYPDVDPTTAGYLRDVAGDIADAHEAWVFTDTMGKWNLVVAPVTVVAKTLHLPEPFLLPAGNWARTWWDMPERTDLQELGWAAAGGKPLAEYRPGGRW